MPKLLLSLFTFSRANNFLHAAMLPSWMNNFFSSFILNEFLWMKKFLIFFIFLLSNFFFYSNKTFSFVITFFPSHPQQIQHPSYFFYHSPHNNILTKKKLTLNNKKTSTTNKRNSHVSCCLYCSQYEVNVVDD